MGTLVNIDEGIRSVVRQALDDLLLPNDEGGLGKRCLLVYPPVPEPCDNRSSNHARSGAPVPFPPGSSCPCCSGSGFRAREASEEVVLKCNWKPKTFALPVPRLEARVPYSLVETKGYLVDLPKVLRAQHMVLAIPVEPYVRQRFRLAGQPGDKSNIVPGRYFVALWEQVSGG
jgi:hypothetical protein